MKHPTMRSYGCFMPPYSERKTGRKTHCPESMETGIRTVKNRVCRTVSAAQATPGGSHTAAAGAERRRYRTAPEGAATGSTEKET